jgi:hypothetical protein
MLNFLGFYSKNEHFKGVKIGGNRSPGLVFKASNCIE